jgi:hypothetical protein
MDNLCSTENKNAYGTSGKRPLEDQSVDGWIIVNWILEERTGVVWTRLV